MSLHLAKNNFNSGEWSPLLDARANVEKYAGACSRLRNFIPRTFGGIESRPGTQYLGAAKHADKACRLIGFNFSTSTNFVLELGHQYIRFWRFGTLVRDGAGDPLEVATPYDESELFAVQTRQLNDVVYLVHGSHPVQRLVRNADDDWEIAAVSWDYPPMRDENVEATTITPSATTGTITLTASAALFNAGHVGSYWEIVHTPAGAFTDLLLTANGVSNQLYVFGRWDFFTYGIWDGTVALRRFLDGQAEYIRSFSSNSDRNVAASGDEAKPCVIQIECAYQGHSASSSAAVPRALLERTDGRIYGLVKITGYTSSTVVTAEVVSGLASTAATALWSEGAFSDHRGHPRTVEVHEQRLIFGGNESQPQTLWGSTTGDFHNFKRGTADDNGWAYTIATMEANGIQWLASQDGLIVGTSGEEWLMQASDTSQAITPTNVQFKRQSRYGSAPLQAQVMNDVVLFAQRSSRKIREFVYSFAADSYVAPDLTLLAEHVTLSGIKQMAFQQQPDAILWCVTNDGRLLGMTYERDQSVVAWHVHDTDGLIESACTIYGTSPGTDELWLLCSRTINGATARYIERLHTLTRHYLDNADKTRAFYVDCGTEVYSAAKATTVSGLTWLEGKTVQVLADGAVQADKVVSGGFVSLDRPANRVIVGLPFVSLVQPVKLEAPMADGTSSGRKTRVNRVMFRVWNTLELEWTDDPDREGAEWESLSFRSTDMPMGESPPLRTGDEERTHNGGHNDAVKMAVRRVKPLPCNLLAIVYKGDFYGS